MRISSLKNVPENLGCFDIKNFKSSCAVFSNCNISDEMIIPIRSKFVCSIKGKKDDVKRIYNVNNENLFYGSKGIVYKLIDDKLTPFTELKSLSCPIVIKAPINFGNSILLIDENNFICRGDANGAFFMPKGNGYYAYEDMMFVYNETSLYFASRDDEDFLLKEGRFGRIDINGSLGKIVKVGVFDNKLYVVSEFGISTLLLLDSRKDFSLSNTCAIPVAVKENSVKFMGDKILFISGKKLCVFSDNKVEYFDFFLGEKDYAILEEAINYLDRYAFRVLLNKKEYLYTFSIIDKSEELIDATYKIFAENGYYLDTRLNDYCVLGVGKENFFSWESKKTNFDLTKNKCISSITVVGKGDFLLLIESEKAKKEYFISANQTFEKAMINGQDFKFTFTSLDIDSSIEKIRIKYRY